MEIMSLLWRKNNKKSRFFFILKMNNGINRKRVSCARVLEINVWDQMAIWSHWICPYDLRRSWLIISYFTIVKYSFVHKCAACVMYNSSSNNSNEQDISTGLLVTCHNFLVVVAVFPFVVLSMEFYCVSFCSAC